ncbi:MAG: zinc-dependent alcohol dehydrogenase family protein [Deltaproteobacteria bacterium]|nr:zinc-dependent alcohol dehydrogenase family protein [Deltaproteobacteria bacterium]MBW2017395.1 zinc-dependent alcohol dehydrogenase family protein [Deltaproteobacteria bacterium]MBW2129438.1 zinc-dependent alcohol dehydrogenase family protein [Deltaproteobacteria bacterium]MBW2302977.1 zinc-dependent alcohol dehydrogenase family protein [Deltaproteobacteria bacterium]
MKAMVLERITRLSENRTPLRLVDLPEPELSDRDILVRVAACGVCHTEIDEIEGRTPPPSFPMVLGHEIIGRVEKMGPGARRFRVGDRVGIGWIHSACGRCEFCVDGKENLCHAFKATGRDAHGGYAEYTTVPEDFAYPIPEYLSDSEAAPLMCAGAIGYRSLRLSGLQDGQNLGLTGFGASAHLVLKMAAYKYPNSKIFVFARSKKERDFARELGAVWAGATEDASPEKLHAIIDTTPVWKPILEALKNLERGGRLVINAIRKEAVDKEVLLGLDYPEHLWLEKEIKSVANVARIDITEFLQVAAETAIRPEIQEFPLEEANHALAELKDRKIRGAKVLKIGS